MNYISILRFCPALAIAAALAALVAPAHAQGTHSKTTNVPNVIAGTLTPPLPGMTVDKGWTLTTPGPDASAPAYFTIRNAGIAPDTLVSADCPIARKTLLVGPDDKPVAEIPIKPGETLTLGPDGTHLLLEHNRFRLFPKAVVPCSVDFDGAGKIILYLYVESDNASGYRRVHGTPTSH